MSDDSAARRAHRLELLWWAQAPIVCGAYLVISSEPLAEKLILAYLAFASIAAMAVSYGGKGKAAEAKEEASSE